MYGDQQHTGYRVGGRSGMTGNGAGGKAANSNSNGSSNTQGQRRSGAGAGGKTIVNSASNGSTNPSGTSSIPAAAAAASSSPSAAAGSSSPTTSAPAVPRAAPRSQQLASPRSPADYQSSPTIGGSPKASPGSRSYHGSAFTSPNAPGSGAGGMGNAAGVNGVAGGSFHKSMDMAVRSGFERFIAEENLERTNVPLSELRTVPGTNTVKVGYDGPAILRAITETVQEQDPTAIFTISLPVVVYAQMNQLQQDMVAVSEAVYKGSSASSPTSFEPVLVFDGIPLSPMVDNPTWAAPSAPTEITPFHGQIPQHAAGLLTFNLKKLVADRFRLEEDVESYLIRCLRDAFPQVFRAPYCAWAQLSAFFSQTNRYISEVCGSLELLAFPGIDRVITRFSAETKTFNYVDKAAVLAAINARHNAAALSERDLGAIILTDTMQRPYRLPALNDVSLDEMVAKMSRSDALPDGRGRGYNFSRQFPDQKRQINVNYSLLDAPVLTCDAHILPLYTVYGIAPHSCLLPRETFGRPLPAIMYMALFSGLVMPGPLAAISQGTLSDGWPLIDSADYRKRLDFTVPIRMHTSTHLVSVFDDLRLPSQWYRKYIVRAPSEKVIPVSPPQEVPLNEWRLDGRNPPEGDVGEYFLDVLPLYSLSAVPPPHGVDHPLYHGVTDTTAMVLLKTLDQLGYYTHSLESDANGEVIEVHSQESSCAMALHSFQCNTLSEYGLLCIELLRTRSLHDNPIQLTVVANKQYQRDIQPGVRFACRLLSIVPINISGTWTAPFSPEIAAFGCIARMLSRSIRELMESITLTAFATHRTDVPITSMNEVIWRLPLGLPIEFGAGHIMNYLLCNEQCSLEELMTVFPECEMLPDDLATLFWFWSMAVDAMCKLCNETDIDMVMVKKAHIAITNAAMRVSPDSYAYLAPLEPYIDSVIPQGIAPMQDLGFHQGLASL